MNSVLKTVLLLVQMVNTLWSRRERRLYRQRVAAIRANPVAEWNRRFKSPPRQLPDDYATPDEAGLPTPTTHAASSVPAGGVSDPRGHDQPDAVLREGGGMHQLELDLTHFPKEK